MSDEKMKKVYGIDLGTTYSAIAYVNEYGKPEIITNSDNERVTPSVVYFESLQNPVVGKIAKESAKTDPDRVVDFVKRQMSNPDWTFELDGESFRPELISSLILKRLAGDANKSGNHEVKDVVITCPAYFGDLERSRTRQAGELAGLNVVEILDEPVAAAIYYGLNVPDSKGKNIIVYDLGGGTFDVTVVRIGSDPDKNEIDIICTEGDHMLGGKDWDDAIFNYYDEQFREETGSDANLKEDNETAYDLRLAAESDKKTLTNRDKTQRRVSFDGEKVTVELPLEKFEELTESLLERTMSLTNTVLDQAKVKGVDKIDGFLLVGGSTRMRQVRRKIMEVFSSRLGVEPVDFDVDEAVAKGAALIGEFAAIRNYVIGGLGGTSSKSTSADNSDIPSMIDSDANDDEIFDLTPSSDDIARFAEETGKTEEEILLAVTTTIKKVATKSYGIQALKDGVEIIRNLIIKQTPVPTSGSQTFKTACANAEEIDLIVFANNENGDSAELSMGEEIGQTVFQLPPGLPDRAPIEVTFNLRDDGTLFLTALDKTFNKKIEAPFKAVGVMSEEELANAKRQARSIIVD